MAKYAVSHKGAEELRTLSKKLIMQLLEIEKQNKTLTTRISSSKGLGVFENEILSIVSSMSNYIYNAQNDFFYIGTELLNLANQIDYLCGIDTGSLTSKKTRFTPMQELSQYMNSHNYGKGDYDIYSKDSTWKELHKKVFSDYHQIADKMSYENKRKWVEIATGLIDDTAVSQITNSLEYYTTDAGYHDIHRDVSGKLQSTKDILRIFDTNRVPVFQGVIYRGLSFESKHKLNKALARGKGNWIEPSITSFSADKSVAIRFASQEKWGLILVCKKNKTAIPYQHLSVIPSENEVLSPGSHRNSGWRIDFDSKIIDNKNHKVYIDIYEN